MSIHIDLGNSSYPPNETTIAKDEQQVDEGVRALMSNSMNRKRLIGLDTIRTAARCPFIAVLQLCDQSQCLIVMLTSFIRLPKSLYNFLSLPAFTFVGFAIKDALATLRQEYGLVCKNALEAMPSRLPSAAFNVHATMRILVTMHIPPADQCISDFWDANGNLTEESIKLAVSNAHAAFRIGDQIMYGYY